MDCCNPLIICKFWLTAISQTSPTSKDATTPSAEDSNELTTDKSRSAKSADNEGEGRSEKKNNSTTASAFKSSGMSTFATQASPFLSAGTGQTLSSFASPSPTPSFGLSSSTKSVFESGSSSSNGAASPFGKISSSTAFGSTTFGGFSGGLGGSRLTTFGKPGESLKSGKPARPFGAPASDGEDEDEDDEGNASDNGKDDAENLHAEDDKAAETEDKKNKKLQRGEIPNSSVTQLLR